MEDKVQSLTEEVDHLKSQCAKLEENLSETLVRAEECDNLREALASKSALLDKIVES